MRKFHFTVSNIDYDFEKKDILPEKYEIESFNNEIKRNIIEEGYYTEATYTFTYLTKFLNPRVYDGNLIKYHKQPKCFHS